MLIGRKVECERLDALLEGARAGRSGVLVVRGEAGVGKTVLLDYAAGQATGLRVLRARGVEAESGLAFAALDELLRPVLSFLEALPERQAAALKGALALSEASEVDRFAAYVAALGLLAAAAEAGPLLALVDDAHWLDGSSAEALVFAGRRLEAEGIALVFAAREGDPEEFAAPGFDELKVHGLDRDAAGRLLEQRGAHRVASRVADRLAAETAGNPLALIELGQLLTPEQLAGEQPLGEPLAAGDAAQRAFLRRARALSAPARGALVVAACAGDGELAPLLAALDGLGLGAGPLGEIEAAGLIGVGDGRLAFEHPLVRSAVYTAADPAERRQAHRAIADAFGERRLDRRAWHLAAAALEPDEEVAAALEQAADMARRRSGYAAAAAALERAGRLTPDGRMRVARMVAAAEAARLAGRAERALALLEEVLVEATDSSDRAQIEQQRGRIEFWRGRVQRASERYIAAAGLIEASNPALAALLLVEASAAAQFGGDASAALTAARRANAAARGRGEVIERATEVMLGNSLYWLGDAQAAHRLLASAGAALVDGRYVEQLDAEYALTTANVLLWTGERPATARTLATRLIEEGRADSAFFLLPFALYVSCRLDLHAGRWATAYASAAEGVRIATDTGDVLWRTHDLAVMALIEAARGRELNCRAHVEQATALTTGHESARPTEADEALGLLELGAGRPEHAIAHLECATRALGGPSSLGRLARPSLGDVIEAHTRSGRAPPKELVATVMRAGEGDFDGTAAVVERCRALVASDADADAHFARALELHGSGWPFHRARTELCYGERLRRAGRRVDARVQLRAALETFERLGARPWAERASAELRATGERIARRDPTASEQLTPQELQIALTVARGATNREAGAALFLSPKTIDFHLGRVYRKLGLRSRTELAHTLRDALAPIDEQ